MELLDDERSFSEEEEEEEEDLSGEELDEELDEGVLGVLEEELLEDEFALEAPLPEELLDDEPVEDPVEDPLDDDPVDDDDPSRAELADEPVAPASGDSNDVELPVGSVNPAQPATNAAAGALTSRRRKVRRASSG